MTTEKFTPTHAQVLDALRTINDRDRRTRTGPYRGYPKTDLAKLIMNQAGAPFDSRAAGNYASHGETIRAQFKMHALEQALHHLIETGEVVSYRAEDVGGRYATSGRAILYFAREVDEMRKDRIARMERNASRDEAAIAARDAVLARHDDEIRAEYEAACERLGLLPGREALDVEPGQ